MKVSRVLAVLLLALSLFATCGQRGPASTNIHTIVANAVRAGRQSVTIPPGTYQLDRALFIPGGTSNFTINATGVTLKHKANSFYTGRLISVGDNDRTVAGDNTKFEYWSSAIPCEALADRDATTITKEGSSTQAAGYFVLTDGTQSVGDQGTYYVKRELVYGSSSASTTFTFARQPTRIVGGGTGQGSTYAASAVLVPLNTRATRNLTINGLTLDGSNVSGGYADHLAHFAYVDGLTLNGVTARYFFAEGITTMLCRSITYSASSALYSNGNSGGEGYAFADYGAYNTRSLNCTFTDTVKTPLVVTGATNATPIVITTSTSHGYVTGDRVLVASVGGNTAANADWAAITVVTPTTFSLTGSVGSGAYTSGGTVVKLAGIRHVHYAAYGCSNKYQYNTVATDTLDDAGTPIFEAAAHVGPDNDCKMLNCYAVGKAKGVGLGGHQLFGYGSTGVVVTNVDANGGDALVAMDTTGTYTDLANVRNVIFIGTGLRTSPAGVTPSAATGPGNCTFVRLEARNLQTNSGFSTNGGATGNHRLTGTITLTDCTVNQDTDDSNTVNLASESDFTLTISGGTYSNSTGTVYRICDVGKASGGTATLNVTGAIFTHTSGGGTREAFRLLGTGAVGTVDGNSFNLWPGVNFMLDSGTWSNETTDPDLGVSPLAALIQEQFSLR